MVQINSKLKQSIEIKSASSLIYLFGKAFPFDKSHVFTMKRDLVLNFGTIRALIVPHLAYLG